jgi:hypothetical protein
LNIMRTRCARPVIASPQFAADDDVSSAAGPDSSAG